MECNFGDHNTSIKRLTSMLSSYQTSKLLLVIAMKRTTNKTEIINLHQVSSGIFSIATLSDVFNASAKVKN